MENIVNLKEITVKEKTEILNELKKVHEKLGITFDAKKMETTINRSNSYEIDTVVELTGEVNLAEPVVINGRTVNTYPCAYGTKGEKIAIRHLLEDSNLQGFLTEGPCEIEYDEGKSKVSKTVVSIKSESFDKERDLGLVADNVLIASALLRKSGELRGKRIVKVYDGYKPFIAKQNSLPNSSERYKAGYKRAIRKQVWQLEG